MGKIEIPLDRRLTSEEAWANVQVMAWSDDESERDISAFFDDDDPHAIIRGHQHGDARFDIAFDYGHDNRAVLFHRVDIDTGFVEIIPLKALSVLNPPMYELYHLTEKQQQSNNRKARNRS